MSDDSCLNSEIIFSVAERIGFDDPCKGCRGLGIRVYGSTSTWRGGIGGAAMTSGVCDKCWGSGSANRQWPSHREFYALKSKAEKETKR